MELDTRGMFIDQMDSFTHAQLVVVAKDPDISVSQRIRALKMISELELLYPPVFGMADFKFATSMK